jgi:signal transduction histidine kinase
MYEAAMNYQREQERAKRLIAMGQMAASLAHEIRNPLGSMELYCTLLKRDLENQPSSFQLAEQIHSGIKILDRIITSCLQFARDLVPRVKCLEDTAELFREVRTCVQARAEKNGVAVEFEEAGSCPVFADPYLVGQALVNVVLNAIEAITESPAPAAAPRVLVRSGRLDPQRWLLQVIDNGPGITKEEQDKVFDPFFSTKDGGTGLGLAIVHSIVSAHQGTISINSEVGQGTTVEFEFPRPDDHLQD